MAPAFIFDADAFNFLCALRVMDALTEPLRDHRLALHFVQHVAREIKGPNRDLIDRLEKQGSAHIHRFRPSDAAGRRFENLMKDRRKAKGGPVHTGECATVAWALASGDSSPIVVAEKAGRLFTQSAGLTAFRIDEFTFECVRLGLLEGVSAAAHLERWQSTQGRPPNFDFDAGLATHIRTREAGNQPTSPEG